MVGHRAAVSTGAALDCCPVGKRLLCAFLGPEPTEVSGENQKVLSCASMAPSVFSPIFGTIRHRAPELSCRANQHARRAERCGLLGGDWEHNQIEAGFLKRPFSSKWVPLLVFLGFCAWISP